MEHIFIEELWIDVMVCAKLSSKSCGLTVWAKLFPKGLRLHSLNLIISKGLLVALCTWYKNLEADFKVCLPLASQNSCQRMRREKGNETDVCETKRRQMSSQHPRAASSRFGSHNFQRVAA